MYSYNHPLYKKMLLISEKKKKIHYNGYEALVKGMTNAINLA